MKAIKEGEDLNAGEEAEDSDYETDPEQGSASEEEVDNKEETGPESLPVLTWDRLPGTCSVRS